MPAVKKPATQRMGNWPNATPKISSLLQKPARGGMPLIAMQPMKKVAPVIGMNLRRPPMRRMSWASTGSWPTTSSMAWITDPEPRKSMALKNAWVTRWNIPATGAPQPIASIM